MEELPLFAKSKAKCSAWPWPTRSCVDRKKKPYLIPVRFVAACVRGHIQDFPFMAWVHRNATPADGCRLRLLAGRSSAGLTGIKITCTCGQIRSLGGIFDFNDQDGGALHRLGCDCEGFRPWLGEWENPSGCGEFLQVVQRGASNVYFPQVMSSIYLPLWVESASSGVVKALEDPRVWEPLSSGLVDGKISTDRSEMVASMRGLDPEEFHKAAQRKLEGIPEASKLSTQTESAFRQSEYDALKTGHNAPQSDLLVKPAQLEDYESSISSCFSHLSLVHKLRETRALAGFTRILPPDGDLGSDRLQGLSLDRRIDWLPATIVRGEGIFIEFDRARLDAWGASHPEIDKRIEHMNHAYNARRIAQGQLPRLITANLVLLHTFAHILINQLAYDCGYGSASLRERLYCDIGEDDCLMSGVLIYTASGDSEGSMGGLVRQGDPGIFEKLVTRAIQKATWCSSDPICIESPGQGTDSCNLAACHGCCLIPETSCEEGNRLLDRALLIGTPTDPSIGFFTDLLS
jgi:hypothetical protein